MRLVAIWFMAALLGCGGAPPVRTASQVPTARRRTCLVLSVGGPAGIAHLGAIEALRERRLDVSAVVGNSMGSLVGALYASDPGHDTTLHFRTLLDQYVYQTENEAAMKASSFGLLGLLALGPFGALAGAATGLGATTKLEHKRLVAVLNDYLGNSSINELKLPFRTSHVVVNNGKTGMVESSKGNVAEAVGASVANPYIFRELDVRAGGPIDPGLDRVAAVPIEQACSDFPSHQLVAINVTSEPAFVSTNMRCPTFEVRIHVPDLDPSAVFTNATSFADVVAVGRNATRAWLATDAGREFIASAPQTL